jgi:hypothetical protein
MSDFTRRDFREIAPLIREAIRREDFEGFKEILVGKLKIAQGSDDFRSYEALFWQAIGARRTQRQR